jgi:hypothetical protein
LRPVFLFALVEWRMLRRSVRTWLLGLLLVFVTRYFFNYQLGIATRNEAWRQVGGSLAAWALDPIGAALLLVMLLFAIDACGWAQRRDYNEVLYPRPFSNGALVLGRFLGIYLTVALLALVPLATLAVLTSLKAGPTLDLGACVFVYLHIWLPAGAAVVASALWIRGLVPHTLGAGAMATLGWALLIYSSRQLPDDSLFRLPLENLILQYNYAAGPGMLLVGGALHGFILILVLLAGLMLGLAAWQIDRMGKRSAYRGARWWQTPNLRSMLLSFWPRSRPGIIALALFLFSASGLLLMAVEDVKKHRERQAFAQEMESEIAQLTGKEKYASVRSTNRLEGMVVGATPTAVIVEERHLTLSYDPVSTRLRATARLALDPASVGGEAHFTLNPGLRVFSVEDGTGAALDYKQVFNRLIVRGNSPSGEIKVEYEGTLLRRIAVANGLARYRRILPTKRWISLPSDQRWFPEPVRARGIGGSIPALSHAVAQAATFSFRGQSCGQLQWVASGTRDETGVWQAYTRTSDIGLLLGPYRESNVRAAGLPVGLYHFRHSEQTALLYLWDAQLVFQEISELLGSYPFPKLTVVEVPGRHRPKSGAAIQYLTGLNLAKVALREMKEKDKEWVDIRKRFHYLDLWQVEDLQQQLISDYLVAGMQPRTPLLGKALPDYYGEILISFWRENEMKKKTRNFDVNKKLAKYFEMPLDEVEATRFPEREEVVSKRQKALFHMLRFHLGSERWKRLMASYCKQYRFCPVEWKDFIKLAEEELGESLDDFQREWILEGVLPKYEIMRAQAVMVDSTTSLGIDYKVRIDVRNLGSGSTVVPVYLRTEGDHVFLRPKVAAGETARLELLVPDRPVYTEIDPQGWILQSPRYQPGSESYAHDYRKVEIWEREPGT